MRQPPHLLRCHHPHRETYPLNTVLPDSPSGPLYTPDAWQFPHRPPRPDSTCPRNKWHRDNSGQRNAHTSPLPSLYPLLHRYRPDSRSPVHTVPLHSPAWQTAAASTAFSAHSFSRLNRNDSCWQAGIVLLHRPVPQHSETVPLLFPCPP